MESERSPLPSTVRGVVRILVVDDHPIVRQGLISLIEREANLEVCGEAEGMAEAIRAYRDTSPDLVIVDLSLKSGSGLELIKELHAQHPNLKALVVSTHEEQLFAERTLRAGAKGFVQKDQTAKQLSEAVHTVLDGRIYLSDRMSDQMLCRSIGGSNDGDAQTPIETLSDRELDVFEQIGKGITTKQIADNLNLSRKTIETYRENIKAKLRLNNASELTRHAVQWVLERS